MTQSTTIAELPPAPARRLPIWKKAALGLLVLVLFSAVLEGVLALCGVAHSSDDRESLRRLQRK